MRDHVAVEGLLSAREVMALENLECVMVCGTWERRVSVTVRMLIEEKRTSEKTSGTRTVDRCLGYKCICGVSEYMRL